MLERIGVARMGDLFASIPDEVRLAAPLDVPAAKPEWVLIDHVRRLAERNATVHTHLSFLGGGSYEHHIPSVVDALASRGEFLTSYTPYQPEMSQGLLQALFEYQECVARLTGLPIVNSSCYDGATALADGAWMCCVANGARSGSPVAVVSELVWPEHRSVLASYLQGREVELIACRSDPSTGRMDPAALEELLVREAPPVVLFQSPNALGVIEDVATVASLCRRHGALSVLSYNPLLSGLLAPPGELGVDVVTGSGQPLGLPLRAGGSGLGIFSTRREFRRYVPGRLVGKVTDIKGNLAYALVYEDREQHVAREKATSNICSNQALNAVRCAIHLAAVGEAGLEEICRLNVRRSHDLADRLCRIPGVRMARSGPFFNEFALELPRPTGAVLSDLESLGIFGGLDVSSSAGGGDRTLLIAVTETKSEQDLERMESAMRKVLS